MTPRSGRASATALARPLTVAATTAKEAAAASYTSLPAHVYAPSYKTYLAPNTP